MEQDHKGFPDRGAEDRQEGAEGQQADEKAMSGEAGV